MDKLLDCVIIGGGPGGLTAGIYLQRFLRNCIVLDNGLSRAATIPWSHNYPGFPRGIKGTELLARLKKQFDRYGGKLINDTVRELRQEDTGFLVISRKYYYRTKYVILATGATDIEPSLPNLHDTIRAGLIHHCPVCDGYEARDKHIAIIGSAEKGVKEALFLYGYSKKIMLFTLGGEIKTGKMRQLKRLGIQVVTSGVKCVTLNKKNAIHSLTTHNDCTYVFDTIYSALGSIINSKMAIDLGAKNLEQCLEVNSHQETTVKGLFAVGDVVKGLDQISIATAGAAIATTEIHNRLLKNEQEKRR